MAKKKIDVEVVDARTLTRDPRNRRRRTARSAGMIRDSFTKVGAGRGIFLDKDNQIVAGNGVIENSGHVVKRVVIVDTDRNTLVATRRKDLTGDEARLAAMYDNRTSDLSEFDVTQLAADHAAGLDLSPFFTGEELDKMIGQDVDAMPDLQELELTPRAPVTWVLAAVPTDRWLDVQDAFATIEDVATFFEQTTR